MQSHKTISLLAFVGAVVVVGATFLPALPAQGHQNLLPTFEVKFPQEADKMEFVNSWGDVRSGGRRHKGSDLMAIKMIEVYAIADGVVGTMRSSALAGRYLAIEHSDGWDSYYIHLNNDNPGTDDGRADWSLTVAPGIEVGAETKAGQLIGWVGDSGNAEWSGSHTHVELLHDGVNVNPYHILKMAYDRDLAELDFNKQLVDQRLGDHAIVWASSRSRTVFTNWASQGSTVATSLVFVGGVGSDVTQITLITAAASIALIHDARTVSGLSANDRSRLSVAASLIRTAEKHLIAAASM